jgi:hypothetical protein
MLRNSTCEEFVRWREYLISIIPSNSVDAPRAASQADARTQLAMKGAHLQQLLTATSATHEDGDHGEQAIVHDVHARLEPTGHGPQI